jgi:hypothetical protein
MSSQLAQLVTSVAARVNDSTILFETGKLKINHHAQLRRAIFMRPSGVLRPSAAPKRAPLGIPVSGVGVTEYARFTREELIKLVLSAENEDALDILFDSVVNAIFDVGGPNVLVESEQPYDWAGEDSEHAGAHNSRNPSMTFIFKMRVLSHPHTQPFAQLATLIATITEGSGVVGILDQDLTAVGAWLRLQASPILAGKYQTWNDVLNPTNPVVQAVVGRQPAAATSANGLPIMTWDGGDVMPWTLITGNNATAEWGLQLWLKPSANVTSRQRLFKAFFPGATGKVQIDIVSGGYEINWYLDGTNGRQQLVAGAVTAGVWQCPRFQFRGAGSNDSERMQCFVNEVVKPSTYNNIGTGPAMTSITNASGFFTIGAREDQDAPTSPLLVGTQTGSNLFVYQATPSAALATGLMILDAPT